MADLKRAGNVPVCSDTATGFPVWRLAMMTGAKTSMVHMSWLLSVAPPTTNHGCRSTTHYSA